MERHELLKIEFKEQQTQYSSFFLKNENFGLRGTRALPRAFESYNDV